MLQVSRLKNINTVSFFVEAKMADVILGILVAVSYLTLQPTQNKFLLVSVYCVE